MGLHGVSHILECLGATFERQMGYYESSGSQIFMLEKQTVGLSLLPTIKM